ncbi:MAG TPA: hypothetical protein VKV77_14325 [Methylovirgula sp.]|nr:hypothetical protein [Methylovirgula sp.]
MKYLLLAGVLALGGCAQFDDAVDNIVAWIDAPKTQQAFSSLKSGATALTCAVADASAVAAEIEHGVGAGQSIIGTDGKVYVASATVCAALGGVVGSVAVVP